MNAKVMLYGTVSCGLVLLPDLGYAHKCVNSKPNILLLLVDDMGYKDTGFTGSDYYETPFIDSLAEKSMVFNQAYACAGNSAPSRSCLISGQFTPRNGVYAVYNTARGPEEFMRLMPYPNESNLPLECYTIAEAMKDAGYKTGIVGKWHLGDSLHSPGMQGFDFVDIDNPISKEEFQQSGDPKNMFSEIEAMIGFIENSISENKPFFGYLPFHAVHTVWQARKEYIDYFNEKKPGRRHDEPVYAAMVKHLDDAVRYLVEKMEDLEVLDNTIIVFTSDNGGIPKTSQEPLRGFKGCLYEGGIRVPMFIFCPEKVMSGSTDFPVANVDLFPTLVDFASAVVPEDKIFDGISLKEMLCEKGFPAERSKPLYWHFPGYLDRPCPGGRDQLFRQRPSTVMRKGRWKLTLYYEEWMLDGGWQTRDKNNSIELYDLDKDISETDNVAAQFPEVRDSLLKEMLTWLKYNNVDLPYIKKE